MIKNEELLPLGSIVYLEEGTVKLMIVGRGSYMMIQKVLVNCLLTIWGFYIRLAFNRINFIFPT